MGNNQNNCSNYTDAPFFVKEIPKTNPTPYLTTKGR
jgi:hypothetical protein